MFAGGTNKKDKKLVNSILSIEGIFEQTNTLPNSNNINQIMDKITSETSNSNSSKSNNSSNNNENDFFGFESIELPKEEVIGDYCIVSNSVFSDDSIHLKSCKTIKEEKQKVDLINLIIINKTFKPKKNLPSIKSYITSIYYNKNNTKDKFDMTTFKSPCYIYDSNVKEILGDLDINYSNNCFLYMSYRSGFESLRNVGCGNYTSDCGWGCMLRCCQMILSRGIIKNELYKMQNNLKFISNTDILNLKKDTLCLFNDNFIPFKNLKNNPFLTEIYQKYHLKENEYELIPPYSIYVLCKLSKSSGVYTSDMKIIKCFIDINEQLFKQSFGIVHFENGVIEKKKLLETFCIKRDITKKIENQKVLINPITNMESFSYQNNDLNDPLGTVNIFDYYGEEYTFCKGGLVFISLRLGLRELDPYYYDIIPLLFEKFHNNIGFVSGKKNRAFYFIGFNGDNKIIYADPHLNQRAENDDIASYEIKDLYLLNVKELSSGLTIGININNSTDLKILLSELQWFCKNHSNVMTFK